MDIIYQAENIIDAHLIRGLLEEEGIPAVVDGHYLSGGLGELPVIGLVHVRVPSDFVQRSREIIDDYESAAQDSEEDIELPANPEPLSP